MPNFKVYKLLFPDLICTDVNLPGLRVRQDDIDDAWEKQKHDHRGTHTPFAFRKLFLSDFEVLLAFR